MGNSIELKSVKDLLGMSFYIPNYQRGYRWEQTQVIDLLEDILAFSKTRKEEGEIYCIQPLVVSQKDEEDILEKCKKALSLEDIRRYLRGTWNVVDGQQRLTTIYLALCYLEIPNKYEIVYCTREGSSKFLLSFGNENTGAERERLNYEDNIDFFFMYHAYKAIESWFKNHIGEKDKFKETLLTDVKFIWYHVASDQEIPVFKRLNIGKIPLTDSELIKALFLNRGNFSFESKDVEYIQERIASEWDQIEYRLQDDEFWSFINNIDYEKPTRIDYILDLICEKNDLTDLGIDIEVKELCNDSHKTFRYFFIAFNNPKLKNTEDKLKTQYVENIWKKIKYYFQVFEEWYHDYRLFHYVGYLTSISKPCKVSKLIDLYQRSSNKENFVEDIKSEIVKKLHTYSWLKHLKTEDDLKEYAFDQDDNASKQDCVCILLLHNIETIIQQNEKLVSESKYNLPNFTKFPFHLYKKENWQVEHIRPYSGDDLQDKDKQKIFLSLAKEYLVNEDSLRQKIDDFLSDKGNFEFSSILEELNKTGEEQLPDDDKNKLWNFVLLDEATNKEYGNQVFPVKRAFVINKEKGKKIKYTWKNGEIGKQEIEEIAFVPPCTKNVFTKNYTDMPSSMVNWTKEDATGYLNDIQRTLKYYITELLSMDAL